MVEDKKEKKPSAGSYKKLGVLNEVLKNKIILVVDDDVRNISSLTKALEMFQVQVITAVDGKETLTQLKVNRQIDLVLMDMMMPEMDGYEAMKQIRKIQNTKVYPL